MFAITETGHLRRIGRSPPNRDSLEMRGWRFLSENRQWDIDDRDAVIGAIDELHALKELLETASTAWLKRRAIEHCSRRPITLTADPD